MQRRRIGWLGIVNRPPSLCATSGSFSVGAANEPAVVDPLLLDELELPCEVSPHEGEHEAAVDAVVLEHAGRKRRAVVRCRAGSCDAWRASPVMSRVARVGPARVAAGRRLDALQVVAVHERVVALRVAAQVGVVALASRAPAARRSASARPSWPPAIPRRRGPWRCSRRYWRNAATRMWSLRNADVRAVAPECLRLRRDDRAPGLVLVAEDELACLERLLVRVGARRSRCPRRPAG